MTFRYCIFTLILISLVFQGLSQEKLQPIQFSGAVVTGDSLTPVSFTHIVIKGTSKGTISDFYGFFSFVARPNDTVIFSAVGFKKTYYRIPDTLSADHYSMFQVMQRDTVYLSETVIYPWPTPSQFRQAFMNLNIPDDDYERAKKNIALMQLKDNMYGIAMDGKQNYKNFIQEQIRNYYTIGQMPQNNLFNPLAWAALIKAWQNGEFKKKSGTQYITYPPDYE